MKTLFIAFITIATTLTCVAQKGDKSSKKATDEGNGREIVYRGKKITADGAITPEQLLERMKGAEKVETKLVATITSVCQVKGCWMQVDMGNGEMMRVTFKDYGFFVPLDATGKTVIMEGEATMKTVSVDMLRHYAEDAGKSDAEVAAITEPEHKLAFVATGVIVKQ